MAGRGLSGEKDEGRDFFLPMAWWEMEMAVGLGVVQWEVYADADDDDEERTETDYQHAMLHDSVDHDG